jgi:hypothetical protein
MRGNKMRESRNLCLAGFHEFLLLSIHRKMSLLLRRKATGIQGGYVLHCKQNSPFDTNLVVPHQSDLSSYFWSISLHLPGSISWLLINA